jgi:hypothetical protein
MWRPVALTGFIVFASVFLNAQPATLPAAVRTTADAISQEQLAWDLAFLASDELRGRNTPSPGFDAAAGYIERRLAAARLTPAGDAAGYRQHYELRETRMDTESASITVGADQFTFGRDFIMRSWAAPLVGEFAIVHAGDGWVIPERKLDPYAGIDVRGKLVVIDGPRTAQDVGVRQIGRVTPGAQSPFVAAAERGAAGILFVPPASELVRWNESRRANTVRRELEPPVPSAYAATPITSVLLSPPLAKALLNGAAKSVTLRLPSAATTVYRPYNVVAKLEGSDAVLKDQAVTVFAHLDGAVGTRSVNGDDVYNSADDNASGSAALLSIAEQMAKAPRPKRTVIFVWDSGEEQGLWGTRRFVSAPPVPLSQVVAHFNVDMIGASRRPGSADANSARVTERGEVFLIGPHTLSRHVSVLLDRVNAEYLNIRFNRTHDTADSEFFYPRTDAGPFLEREILPIGFTTGIHDRYHLPADEAGVLDPAQMHVIARTVLASIWMVADAAERPRIDQPVPRTVPRYLP